MNKSIIEIDQSGKIEQTSLDTAVALTNGYKYSILIKKKEKRLVEKQIKKLKFPQKISPIVFAIILAYIINATKMSKTVLVDTEYPKYNDRITKKVRETLSKMGHKAQINLKFGFVGKESKADYLAGIVRKGKVKPNIILTSKDILKYL